MTAAFNRALIAELPNLMAGAMKLTRNRTAAEDLVQDTVERALRRQETFAPGTNIGAWLFVIMKNGFINGVRAAARRPTVSLDPDLLPAATISQGRQEDAVFVREVMTGTAQFSTVRRAALYLAADGERYEDIAEIQRVPIGTVRSRVSRARGELLAWANG